MQVKICGLKEKESLQTAIDAGVDYVGCVFFPPSPRNISARDSAELAKIIPPSVKKVAVVVDADDELLEDIIEYFEPDYLQLHGSETPERVEEIKLTFGVPIIKSFSVMTRQDILQSKQYSYADMFLFDAKAPAGSNIPGGNGLQFDWDLLQECSISKPWILSGGLDADSIDAAVRVSKAEIIDVSSGLEIKKGVKDSQLIQQFMSIFK